MKDPPTPRRPLHRRTSSNVDFLEEDSAFTMSSPIPIPPTSRPQPAPAHDSILPDPLPGDKTCGSAALLGESPPNSFEPSSPPTPLLSRTGSFSVSSGGYGDDEEQQFPPLERLTVFDILGNIALPQRLEKLQTSVQAHAEKVRRSQKLLRSTGQSAKDKVVEEWRRRVPPSAEEQLDKYRKRMRQSVDRLGRRWNDSKLVTVREKVSFISSVLNIFLSGYIVGGLPEYFYMWYTAQLVYFMPIRFYNYHKKGYHYFLADLCYFVNLLLMLSIWAFPNSKRLLISTYCLAYGNNAIAILMWRNSLVFHSLDKVTSLFIHIMPCLTLHTLVHLIPPALQAKRFPAIYAIRTASSSPINPVSNSVSSVLPLLKSSNGTYSSLWEMVIWSTLPYAVWQLSYHFFITIRKRQKIAAGRPTSFTWLRKSYAPTWIGKFVLSLPETLQEAAFMGIQYAYAVLTMLPCPVWFWYRWASTAFLSTVFIWAVHNGATYYIDVFGTRFQRELETLKKDVAKWQNTPELGALQTPGPLSGDEERSKRLSIASIPASEADTKEDAPDSGSIVAAVKEGKAKEEVDQLPPLDDCKEGGSGTGRAGLGLNGSADGLRERK